MNKEYYDTVLRLTDLDTRSSAWSFVSDSQDVEAVKQNLGEVANEFDAFFVKVGDGDYDEVWGIHGIVPYTGKTAYKIK